MTNEQKVKANKFFYDVIENLELEEIEYVKDKLINYLNQMQS